MPVLDHLAAIGREHGAHYDRIRHLLPVFEWLAGESAIRPIAVQMLGNVRRGTVLDVGSNVGQNMRHLRAAVGSEGRIVGIDTAEVCVREANTRARTRGYANVEYHVADAHRYVAGFPLDGILMGYCCNVLTDPALAIAQLLKQLKPGKCLVICDARIPASMRGTAAEHLAAQFVRRFLRAEPTRDPVRIMQTYAQDGLVHSAGHHNSRFTYASAWIKM